MGRFIAARPRRPDALGRPADMTVGLDQLRHELGRKVETGLAGEPHDVVVGGCLAHTDTMSRRLGTRHAVFDHEGRQAADRTVLLLLVIERLEADRAT